MPATSWPSTNGVWYFRTRLNSPLRSIVSRGLMPAALTLTSTSPSPTPGSGTSLARSPSVPYRSTTNAFMTVVRRAHSQELERALDEVLVELEHATVAGVGVEDELAVGESLVDVNGVLGGHHPVALAVHDEHRLVNAREVGGLLPAPSVDCFELGAEGADGDGLVSVLGAFLQARQELLAGSAPVRSAGEEEKLLGVLAGE